MMSEQEDKLQKDELTAAYLLGCHNTRKAYESRIKRYNHAVRREPYPMSRMYETAEGKYVQFEDYEALQQRLAEAESEIKQLETPTHFFADDDACTSEGVEVAIETSVSSWGAEEGCGFVEVRCLRELPARLYKVWYEDDLLKFELCEGE